MSFNVNTICKQYGILHCVHSLNVLVLCFHIWPDDGSFEPKYVAQFIILIAIYIVVLLTGINYYIIAIHNGMALIKEHKRVYFTQVWLLSSSLNETECALTKCQSTKPRQRN